MSGLGLFLVASQKLEILKSFPQEGRLKGEYFNFIPEWIIMNVA